MVGQSDLRSGLDRNTDGLPEQLIEGTAQADHKGIVRCLENLAVEGQIVFRRKFTLLQVLAEGLQRPRDLLQVLLCGLVDGKLCVCRLHCLTKDL